MNKKLTLNIDDKIIQFAHEYSQETKQSISSMVESYLLSLQKESDIEDLSSKTKNLYGILSDNPIPDKKELRRAFHEKSID